MNGQLLRQKADQLRAIPLSAVLRAGGAQPDPHDPHKWHTAQGTLSVTGAKFMNWTQGIGGGGAIDLVIHLHRCRFREALDWLDHQDLALPVPLHSGPAPRPLTLPPPDPAQLARVRDYLLQQRGLRPEIIDPLIQSGSLYADPRANAVFLLRGTDGTPVGAELRGTTAHPWRGMAPGSRKDLGFFAIPSIPFPPQADPNPTAILLCESAIDALSARLLHLHRGRPPPSPLATPAPAASPHRVLRLRHRHDRPDHGPSDDHSPSDRPALGPCRSRLERPPPLPSVVVAVGFAPAPS